MEDKFLIIMLAVLAVAGFAAILFFSGLLSKKRRENSAEKLSPGKNARPAEKGELLDEYDRTGIICFDKSGKAAETASDKGGEGLE